MKRIQFILNNRSLYGANRSALSVIEDFISKGHEVKVLVPFWGSMADELKRKNIPYEIIPFYSAFLYIRPILKYLIVPFLLVFDIVIFPYLLFRVNKFNPDIIYSNTSAENIGIFLAKILGIKHIWHIREFMSLDHNSYFILGNKIKSKLINLSDRSIYVSKSVYEYVNLGGKSIKHKVIYNGIESSEASLSNLNFNNSEPVFGIVGILDVGKGQDMAIEYFNKLLAYYPKAKLKIFGDKKGSFKNMIVSRVAALGIGDKVQFKGFVNSHEDIYGKIDFLLMFSKSEGFGRVTIESALKGVPVIGYDNAGTSELIDHKKTGCLFKDFDSFLDCVNFIMIADNYKLVREKSFLNANKNFNTMKYCESVYNFTLVKA